MLTLSICAWTIVIAIQALWIPRLISMDGTRNRSRKAWKQWAVNSFCGSTTTTYAITACRYPRTVLRCARLSYLNLLQSSKQHYYTATRLFSQRVKNAWNLFYQPSIRYSAKFLLCVVEVRPTYAAVVWASESGWIFHNLYTYTAVQWSNTWVSWIAPFAGKDSENASIYKTEEHPTTR